MSLLLKYLITCAVINIIMIIVGWNAGDNPDNEALGLFASYLACIIIDIILAVGFLVYWVV